MSTHEGSTHEESSPERNTPDGSVSITAATSTRATARSSRWRRPSTAVLLALLRAGVVVASGSRLWATSRVTDTGLGTTAASVTGSQAVGPLIALVLAAVAGVLAAVTAGRVGRLIGVVVLAGAALTDAVLVVAFLLDPAQAVGRVAAEAMGRTGTLPVTPTATAWPWVALAGLVLLLGAAVVSALGTSTWRGLSARYESGAADQAGSGPRGERVSTDWDRLSAGEDPTSDAAPPTEVG